MKHDLRHYARQTGFRLILGGLILLFVVGDGLIYIFYGRNAAAAGLLCILAGLVPILLVLLALYVVEWILQRNDRL